MKKITQAKIAAELSMSGAQFSRFLAGKSRSVASAKKIAGIIRKPWWEIYEADGQDLLQHLKEAFNGDRG